ncbi:hypothetical protein HYPSUDRAFT_209263 [Hypholoma sublateritium FD-334 SS-4]|uniref:F-box domain-containing protein n=1 Tax=Hypholoma sublateritium (strain FD-334 SS-4) TaxID=945553 RepID=A0A0D2LSI9_HYPSF|nr:hypothetical protein HYPSUDRAFT_209263 [Hypholoma sublateritium FD-334 SS-4]
MEISSCSAFNRLNADVILEIVRINANMFTDEDALTTTRYASQVCHAWRTTIVNTPLIWARLIDLDSLHGLKSNEWGQEIIRRSGTELLWIKAANDWTRLSRPIAEQRLFFRKIIAENWDRIQKLIISTLVLVHREMWKVPLCHPAPTLEKFRIHSSDRGHSKTVAVMHQFTDLFSGYAPRLRDFSADYHKINLNARWLRNLRSIQLDMVYNIFECLKVLSHAYDLEDIKITGKTASQSESQTPPHPVVDLPKLKRLHLSRHFDDINFILDHLVVPHGCSMSLHTWREVPIHRHDQA